MCYSNLYCEARVVNLDYLVSSFIRLPILSH